MLKVNEIFYSIQGESTRLGMPTIFIRLTGCNLDCIYCDTRYAKDNGKELSIETILKEIKKYDCNIVEVTGGEPLMQQEAHLLLKRLCDEDYKVMLETNGSFTIQKVDRRVKIIMDIKCPSSKMEGNNNYENIKYLKNCDEIKFVISARDDYNWVKSTIEKYDLSACHTILLSTIYEQLELKDLVEWVLKDNLNVRIQPQLHKLIWGANKHGV